MANFGFITALRFPLALLVVFIHAYNAPWQTVEGETLQRFATFFSHTVPAFSVPLFFAISGFLFFRRTSSLTPSLYGDKLWRRVHTLLIPYLVWNLIAFALYALKDMAAGSPLSLDISPDIFWGCKVRGSTGENLFGLPYAAATAPIQLQLWFVRDLLVLTLLAPLFSFLIRCLNWGALLLLGGIYYTHLWGNPGGLSFEGFWYFGLGAWCGIKHIDVAGLARRLFPLSLTLTLLTLLLSPSLIGSSLPPTLRLLVAEVYNYAAILTAIGLATRYAACRQTPPLLADSSFFLYASHTIVLLPLTTAAVSFGSAQGEAIQLLLFLTCPIVAVAICLTAFAFLTRYLPKLSAPLCGKPIR